MTRKNYKNEVFFYNKIRYSQKKNEKQGVLEIHFLNEAFR